MTTHAAILEQVEKYEDGAFVPQYTYHRGTFILRHVAESDLLNYWCEACDDDESMPEELAHRDIERAAFRAVDHFCRKSGCSMLIGRNRVGGMIVSSAECDLENDGSYTFDPIGCGPTEPAMWLAAMKYINGEKA